MNSGNGYSFLPLPPKGRFQILATSNSGQSAMGKCRGHRRWRTYRDTDRLTKDRSSALGADRLFLVHCWSVYGLSPNGQQPFPFSHLDFVLPSQQLASKTRMHVCEFPIPDVQPGNVEFLQGQYHSFKVNTMERMPQCPPCPGFFVSPSWLEDIFPHCHLTIQAKPFLYPQILMIEWSFAYNVVISIQQEKKIFFKHRLWWVYNRGQNWIPPLKG